MSNQAYSKYQCAWCEHEKFIPVESVWHKPATIRTGCDGLCQTIRKFEARGATSDRLDWYEHD